MKYVAEVESVDTNSPGIRFMPPLFFILSLVGGIACELILESGTPLEFRPLFFAAGMLLAGGGVAFMMWGHSHFIKLGVAVRPVKRASMLVVDAAYRYSRNPMYMGFLFILAGLGIAAGSIWMVLTAVPMALYLRAYVIPREEAYLTREFGEDYINYCNKVRRWL